MSAICKTNNWKKNQKKNHMSSTFVHEKVRGACCVCGAETEDLFDSFMQQRQAGWL